MSYSVYLYQSVSVSIFTVSAFIIPTLTPNIPIMFTVIPRYIIIPTALDIQHFLKPFNHLWCDALMTLCMVFNLWICSGFIFEPWS